MTSRGAGAGLALIAAALLAVSIATPSVLPGQLALFAGHPTVHGRVFELQDVYVGLYGAELCNTGGDGACKSREPKTSFQYAALGELGLAGLLGVTAVILALLTLRKSEARKGAAKLVALLALLAAAGAGVLILLGPTDEGAVPIGFGMGVYGAGVVGALLASLIAARPPPPIKLRVAERRPVAAPRPISARQAATVRQGGPARPLPAGSPLDAPARFDDDPPWIGEPRSETGRPRTMDPGGTTSGPGRETWGGAPNAADFSGSSDPLAIPLAQPSADKPLFSSAPHLRPLYDAEPQQGGTGGLLPIERPTLPSRPPTPVSRAQLSESGIPPPSSERSKPRTLPPPSFGARAKPPSVAPPVGESPVAPAPIGVPPAAPTVALPPSSEAMPRTQVSLVPPMPDGDLAIAHAPAPPGDAGLDRDAHLFARPETPLAPPPLPVGLPQRPYRESQLPQRPPSMQQSPRPLRDSQSPPVPPPQLHRDSPSPPAPPPHRDSHLPPLPFSQPPRPHRDHASAPPPLAPPNAQPFPQPPNAQPLFPQPNAQPLFPQPNAQPLFPQNAQPLFPQNAQPLFPQNAQPPFPQPNAQPPFPQPPFAQPPLAQPPGAQTLIAPPPIAASAAPPGAAPPTAVPPVPSPIGQTLIAPPPIVPAPVRAAVPMPARPDRPSQPVVRPPMPGPAARHVPPPRPTISTSVVPPPGFAPPIPAIPTIPPIPVVPRRPDEVTDTEGHGADAQVVESHGTEGDPDQPTVARVPIEIHDNTSKTYISGAPTIEDRDTPMSAPAVHDLLGDPRGSTDFDEAIDTAGRPYIAREVAFGTPETAPTTEQVPFPAEHGGTVDPHDAVTVPAPYRTRGVAPITEPSPSPAFPPASVAVPGTPARDRSVSNLPISTAPESLPPPRESQRSSGPSPACPQCESPMAWVEEHLRFYCRSCRMYF